MKVFFETNKSNKKVELLTYIGYFIFITATYLYVTVPIILMISNLAAFIVLTYNYESKLKKRILSAVLIYIILVCVEITVGLLFGYLNFSLFSANNNYSSVYGIIVCRILSYVAVLILNNYNNIKKGQSVPNSNWFCIILIPTSSLYVILLLFQAQGLSVMQVMVSVMLILLINFATFYLYDVITAALAERMESLLILEQNKYYDRQFELMKASLHSTNAIKHDLKNHMSSINSLVQSGDKKEILNYISDIMEDLGERQYYAASGNSIIDSIINFKFQEAEQRGIKTTLDLNIPEKLEVPSFDMTIILGNLLDNAIKATSEVEGNRYINITIKYDKGRLLIQCDNPYSGEINEDEGRFLTTKVDKDNHGMGLASIKKVIQKYNGTMNVDYGDNIFSIALLIYVE